MKARYQFLMGVLLILVALLSSCADDEYIFKIGGSSGLSSCPNNAWCEEHIYSNSTIYNDYLLTNDTVRIELS